MALASAPNSLQPPSLIAHPLRRQVWHQQSGLAFTVGKQRNGRLFINASAGIEDSTMTSGSELHSDDAGEVSVSARNSTTSRRQLVSFPLASACACLATTLADKGTAIASEYADMPALRGKDYGKTKMKYPDYVETESGLQYKDLREGSGPAPGIGNMVVVDWDGYTIGYYGRIFEARNKAKGGSFEGDDKVFFKFRLGNSEVIPAFEEAVATMKVGGVRRIIVPPELGYPNNDYNQKGPRPATFSGQRALDFVLRNQGLIDKTLLFDIELIKVIA
ncbi:hypothetical protein M758_5G038600 [Ceratodon purpureus]|nr:hypothetical protein M758_5G038600 [Ceratodon purpureus]